MAEQSLQQHALGIRSRHVAHRLDRQREAIPCHIETTQARGVQLKLLVALIFSALLMGCVADIRLEPVQGLISPQTPEPKVVLIPRPHAFFARYDNGEICRGDGSDYRVGTVSESPLAQEWDIAYGQGFFVAHVLGASVHRTLLVSDHGTTILVESGQLTPQSKNSRLGLGVAKDSRGNLYRMPSSAN